MLVSGCLPGGRATSLFLFSCCVVSCAFGCHLCFFLFARVFSSRCPRVSRYLRLFCIVYAILLWLMAVCVRLFSKVFCCIG